jgi:hypothetical protein
MFSGWWVDIRGPRLSHRHPPTLEQRVTNKLELISLVLADTPTRDHSLRAIAYR